MKPSRLTILLLTGLLCGAGAARAADPLFRTDFAGAAPGTVPEGFLVLDGQFAVGADGEARFLELPGAPLETFGVLWGPAHKEDVSASARFFGTGKGRRFPVFGLSLNGVAGYRLQASPAKKALEILRGDAIRTSVPFDWSSDSWTWLRIEVRKTGDKTWAVRGKAWKDGTPEPAEWAVATEESEAPNSGRAAVWGQPFSGTPIRFDDFTLEAVK